MDKHSRRHFIKGAGATVAGFAFPGRLGEEGPPTQARKLFPFDDHALGFDLDQMMLHIREREGWELMAYPDPKDKNVALIGAGFNLSIPEDFKAKSLVNDRDRIEPSTRTLWKAAGLPEEKLDKVLKDYDERRKRWHGNRAIFGILSEFESDITSDDASRLLYISTRQAVYNAMAYFKDFDQMNGPQRMAMSEIVYQIGARLLPWTDKDGEHKGFEKFLAAVNDTSFRDKASPDAEAEHWREVQKELIDSKWFRDHTTRARKVIAMISPVYATDRRAAGREVKDLEDEVRQEKRSADAAKPQGSFTAREGSAPGNEEKQR